MGLDIVQVGGGNVVLAVGIHFLLWPFHPALSPSSLTLRLNDAVSLDLIALPGSPALWMGRTPVTVGQFRAFVESSGYRTDAESSTGQGPGHVGGHGWDAQRHRFDGWWPIHLALHRLAPYGRASCLERPLERRLGFL